MAPYAGVQDARMLETPGLFWSTKLQSLVLSLNI